ncbi:MAG TPA: HAMP domain-containing sensor histidine kinase [Bacteroidia bacterium]|nr:HAMP domain-containing sensor histidine kinase [Bacteroidia bacterium]
MSENKPRSGALLIFYVLVIYIAVQFFWWSFLMVDQSHEIFNRKLELISAFSSPAETKIKQDLLRHEMVQKWYMVAGEGSVFLVILVLGVIMVRRSFRKESELIAKQRTFLHSVTHEFKSPVASLRLQLETLQKRSLTSEQQQIALANAIDDTERLDKLIEKILMAARIDSGELSNQTEFMNLSEKLKELVTQINRSYPRRNVVTNIQSDVFLHIDPWALNSIVSNLMENAFLYSLADKTVVVSLKWEGNMIQLSVKDQGIGIPDKEKKEIFQKFYRSNTTQGYKGTGLGLYLVDYFVKVHNGTIAVKDNTPEGSIFEISFPTTKTDAHR